jgi:hypothetical protein
MNLKKLFHDPTPNQIIGHRLFIRRFDMLQWCDLSDEEKEELHKALHRMCLKLISAWKSMEKYRELTLTLVEASKDAPRLNSASVVRSEPSEELGDLLDSCLTQFKSTLDYLVKLGVPMFGRNRWTLRTFSDHGKKVANALHRLPDRFRPATDELANFLEINEEWLAEVIQFRDWVNHGLDGGPDPFIMEIYSVSNGDAIDTYCPLFKGVPIEKYLEHTWWNIFYFVEAFVAYLHWSRAKAKVRLYFRPVTNDCQHPPWALFPEGILEQIGHPAVCIGKTADSDIKNTQ